MLKSWLTVEALLRRADQAGVMAMVARSGDKDGGAVFVRVIAQDQSCRIFTPTLMDWEGARAWAEPIDRVWGEAEAEAEIAKRAERDPDMWVVDIHDGAGKALLTALAPRDGAQ